jgi:hypothetical protein
MSMIGSLYPLTALELQRLKASDDVQAVIEGDGGVSLEKLWHGLHYLLTGEAEGGEPPLADAILGGTEIGSDMGYGPARYLTPDQVKRISGALSGLTRETLREHFDPADFAENGIYPSIWDEDEDELFDELMGYFDQMSACYRDAAKSGKAMLLVLS